jgi:uncharacterized protein YqeY
MYEQIKKDMVEAMKSGDKFKLNVIRMLKSAIMLKEIEVKPNELTDDDTLAVVKSEVKKRKGSIEEFEKYGKLDQVEDLKKEVEILSVYLPEELSEEALLQIIDEGIKEVGAESIKDMGKVMKYVTEKAGAAADMSKVSVLVKQKLA